MQQVINIGIIGMGGRGRHFFRSYRRESFTGFNVKAICDLNQERLATARKMFGEDFSCHTDMHEMLKQDDLDLVIVATHDPDHVDPTVAALRAGKHVLVEKPLCQTVEDARLIAAEVRRARGMFMMGFELREVTVFKQMKELIDAGKIGDVKVAHVFDNVGRGGCFFHRPHRQKDFFRSLLLQKACHSLDLLNWFAGSRPTRVYGIGGLDVFGPKDEHANVGDLRCCDCEKGDNCPFYAGYSRQTTEYGEKVKSTAYCVWNKGNDLNDNSELCITYANGVKATFHELYFTPEYTREFWLVGTKGKMYGYYDNPGRFLIRISHLMPAKERQERLLDVEEYWPKAMPGSHGGGDFALRAEVYRRIVENDPPADVLESAYYSTALAACAEDSIESGNPIIIPPLPEL